MDATGSAEPEDELVRALLELGSRTRALRDARDAEAREDLRGARNQVLDRIPELRAAVGRAIVERAASEPADERDLTAADGLRTFERKQAALATRIRRLEHHLVVSQASVELRRVHAELQVLPLLREALIDDYAAERVGRTFQAARGLGMDMGVPVADRVRP